MTRTIITTVNVAYLHFVVLSEAFNAVYTFSKVNCIKKRKKNKKCYLVSFSPNSSCQLHVLWHNGHTFGVNSAQVRVFKETNEVGFRGFLESRDGRQFKSKVSLKVRGNLTNESLKG